MEVQAAKLHTEPPSPVSALWGEAEKSAEAAATWGDEVKWWKFNHPDESLSVHVKQARGGGMGEIEVWEAKVWQEVTVREKLCASQTLILPDTPGCSAALLWPWFDLKSNILSRFHFFSSW